MTWIRTYGKGRVFYSALRRNAHIFWNEALLEHFLATISTPWRLESRCRPERRTGLAEKLERSATTRKAMALYDWSHVEKEQVYAQVTRQVIHLDKVSVARIQFAPGAVVPEHAHSNEQITVLLAGRVKLVYEDHEQIVEAGQMIQVPPDVPHGVKALQESVAIDVFAPRRDDWLSSSDAREAECKTARI